MAKDSKLTFERGLCERAKFPAINYASHDIKQLNFLNPYKSSQQLRYTEPHVHMEIFHHIFWAQSLPENALKLASTPTPMTFDWRPRHTIF